MFRPRLAEKWLGEEVLGRFAGMLLKMIVRQKGEIICNVRREKIGVSQGPKTG